MKQLSELDILGFTRSSGSVENAPLALVLAPPVKVLGVTPIYITAIKKTVHE